MKKEESKVIAQKLQKIPNGTLALKHCRAGGTGNTLFGEQFQALQLVRQTGAFPKRTRFAMLTTRRRLASARRFFAA